MSLYQASSSILESMKCPICLDFAENAVETKCCAQVYCAECVEEFKGKDCPSCRKPNLDTSVNRSVRKMLSELPVRCQNNCGETVTRTTSERHQELCPQRKLKCPVADCEYTGQYQHLATHAADTHQKDAVVTLAKALLHATKQDNKVFNCPFSVCQDKDEMKQQELTDHLKDDHLDDFAEKLLNPQVGPIRISNSERRRASMARNGKFYCDRPDGASKHDGGIKKVACSYSNKLNCRSCMKLDVVLRNLPYGSLVNGAGHVTKPTQCTHDVKGSEYFSINFRKSALCQYKTCGKVPKFTCGMPDTDRYDNERCELRTPCEDCDEMNYIYGIHVPRDNGVKEDCDYYASGKSHKIILRKKFSWLDQNDD